MHKESHKKEEFSTKKIIFLPAEALNFFSTGTTIGPPESKALGPTNSGLSLSSDFNPIFFFCRIQQNRKKKTNK